MFNGDLDILQQEALQWLLIEEAENEAEVFETQLRFMLLANNPQLYKAIFPDDEDAEVDWITPESEEDVQNIIAQLESQFASEAELVDGYEG